MRNLSRAAVAAFVVLFAAPGPAAAASKLQSISITPSAAGIVLGLSQQLRAVARYKDGSTGDITEAVNWSTSNQWIATVSNAAGSKGLTSSTSVGGPITITATDAITGVAATAAVTVTPAVVTSIAVSPGELTLEAGHARQYSATATFTDGHVEPVTAAAAWSTTAPAVASVSSTGLVQTTAAGTAFVNASLGGVTGGGALTVTTVPTSLLSIAITPAYFSANPGAVRQFVATGTYSDTGFRDVTAEAVWTTSDAAVATVGPEGSASLVSAGSATITATLGTVAGTATFSIPSVRLAKTGQQTSYGSLDDGAVQAGLAWPVPRFVNADGSSPVSTDAVLDRLTGLVWTRSANAPGPTECSPGGARNLANAFAYIACLNASSYLGYTDWRLPNLLELNSLVNRERVQSISGPETNPPWLLDEGFADIDRSRWFWSSTIASGASSRAVWVSSGATGSNSSAMEGYVWAVRTAGGGVAPLAQTGQRLSVFPGDDAEARAGVPWPSPRFAANADETVTDNLTGLVWPRLANTPAVDGPAGPCTPGPTGWWGATSYVQCLNQNAYLGHTDWRLPNSIELQSLAHVGYLEEPCDFGPCQTAAAWLNTQGFAGVSSNAWYWSSSLGWFTSTFYPFGLQGFEGLDGPSGAMYSNYVWPVRGGW